MLGVPRPTGAVRQHQASPEAQRRFSDRRPGVKRAAALALASGLAGLLLPHRLVGQSAGRLQVEARVLEAEAAWEGVQGAAGAVRELATLEGKVPVLRSDLADVSVMRPRRGGAGDVVVVTIQYLHN